MVSLAKFTIRSSLVTKKSNLSPKATFYGSFQEPKLDTKEGIGLQLAIFDRKFYNLGLLAPN